MVHTFETAMTVVMDETVKTVCDAGLTDEKAETAVMVEAVETTVTDEAVETKYNLDSCDN